MRWIKFAALAAAAMALGLIAARTGEAPDAAAATVKVAGLRVVDAGEGKGFGGLRAFNWTQGTSVALMVSVPAGGLIEFDHTASKLDKMVDDKGTDLLKGKGDMNFSSAGFSMMAQMSKDGKAAMVDADGPSLPAKEAREISIAGTMVFQRATGRETLQQENVALKQGEKIKAGKIAFEIIKAGKPDWSNAPMQITLSANQDCTSIAAIRFLDAAGKEIEAEPAGGSTMRMMGKVVVEKNFNFPAKIDKATVAIEYWKDMTDLKVPFSLKASVGL